MKKRKVVVQFPFLLLSTVSVLTAAFAVPSTAAAQREGQSVTSEPCAEQGPVPAVGVHSWTLLKGALAQLSKQLKHVLLVRTDLEHLQGDLATQKDVWQTSDRDLNKSTASLLVRSELLVQQVEQGARVKDEIAILQARINATSARMRRTADAHDHWAKQRDLQAQFLKHRLAQLQGQYTATRERQATELSKARSLQRNVTESASLGQSDLDSAEATRMDSEAALRASKLTANAKTAELTSRLSTSKATLSWTKDQLRPDPAVQSERREIMKGLEQQTQNIINAQSDDVRVAADCKERQQAFEEALSAQTTIAESARDKMLPLCKAADTTHALYKGELVQLCPKA